MVTTSLPASITPHKPITLSPGQVDTMHYVSAIVKPTKYIDKCESETKLTLVPPLID